MPKNFHQQFFFGFHCFDPRRWIVCLAAESAAELGQILQRVLCRDFIHLPQPRDLDDTGIHQITPNSHDDHTMPCLGHSVPFTANHKSARITHHKVLRPLFTFIHMDRQKNVPVSARATSHGS